MNSPQNDHTPPIGNLEKGPGPKGAWKTKHSQIKFFLFARGGCARKACNLRTFHIVPGCSLYGLRLPEPPRKRAPQGQGPVGKSLKTSSFSVILSMGALALGALLRGVPGMRKPPGENGTTRFANVLFSRPR